MKQRQLGSSTTVISAVDWHRRLFDGFMPLPDGTSYNAYLVRGAEKTALIDTVDASFEFAFFAQFENVERIDYIISQHAEQDHSGLIPEVLDLFPEAKVLCTKKAKDMLVDHLDMDEGRVTEVKDGETLDLGDVSLEFLVTPWVHWPETMCTYSPEDRLLFSCDFFGAHLATPYLYASDDHRSLDAAKLYYAQIMMPMANFISRHLKKLEKFDVATIAPSHGPVIDQPQTIIEAYESWVSGDAKNHVVIPFASMHGSTEVMVDHLVESLMALNVPVWPFDMTAADLGRMAATLVDASTVVFGTPTVLNGPHPKVVHAANVIDLLQPPLKFVSLIGSFGWGTKLGKQVADMLPHFKKIEVLEPVLCRGLPRDEDLAALDRLAQAIAGKQV